MPKSQHRLCPKSSVSHRSQFNAFSYFSNRPRLKGSLAIKIKKGKEEGKRTRIGIITKHAYDNKPDHNHKINIYQRNWAYENHESDIQITID